ncbi:SpaA isopeptide-forming pilin-related protein [Lactococcus hircilactis]|uniref:SpaA isopeptide-forming pilin-related protein n=1 Tax=Lactococcus hircilactis TaxID=1494462 RepID=UPI003FA20D1B
MKKQLTESKTSHFRQWKKGKHWLYGATALAFLIGGAGTLTYLANNPTTVAHALTLPSGSTQIGSIGSAPVIQTSSNSFSSMQPLFDSLTNGLTPQYIAGDVHDGTGGQSIGWNSNTTYAGTSIANANSLVSGNTGIASATIMTSLGSTADGFQSSDNFNYVGKGQYIDIHNIGTAYNTQTKQNVPISMEVTINDATMYDAVGDSTIYNVFSQGYRLLVAARNVGGNITLGYMVSMDGVAAPNTGVGSEGGGGGGAFGTSVGGASVGIPESVSATVTFYDENTKQNLPTDSTLMAMKVSDIDMAQAAEVNPNGVLGFIVSNPTNLAIKNNILTANSTNTVVTDSSQLNPNSYIVLKNYNSNNVNFTDTAGNQHQGNIIEALFGNMGTTSPRLSSGAVKIVKKDKDTGKPIAGAKFSFLDKNGNVMTKDAAGNGLPNGGVFTTGSDGTVTIENLPADGTVAKVREVFVPLPYTLSNNLVSVVNADGSSASPSTDMPVSVVAGTTKDNPTGVTFADNKQKIYLKVTKKSSETGMPSQYSLQNAVFEVRDSGGTLLGQVKTNADGTVQTKSAAYVALVNQMNVQSDYTVTEVSAPTNMALNPNGFKINVSYSGDDSELVNPTAATGTVTDKPVVGNLIINKTDQTTADGKPSGDQSLKNQLWGIIYDGDQNGHKDGALLTYGDEIASKPFQLVAGNGAGSGTTSSDQVSVKLDENGHAEIDNVPAGNYKLVELSVTNDYVKNTQEYPFAVTWTPTQTNDVEIDTQNVTNQPQTQDISVQKGGKLNGTALLNNAYSLLGNVFEIKDVSRNITVGTITTDDSGKATTEGSLTNKMIVGDHFTIQEIKSGDGMALTWNDGKPQAFTLDYDESSANKAVLINPTVKDETNDFTNQEDLVNSSITKNDADTGSSLTQGAAQLQGSIYTWFYAHDIKDAKGNVIHKTGDPVDLSDGFKNLPIAVLNGKLVGKKYLSLQMADGVDKNAVQNLPITGPEGDKGYYIQEVKVTDDGTVSNGAPWGYTQDTTKHYVVSGQHDSDGLSNQNTITSDLTVSDKVIRFNLELQKLQDDNGGANGTASTVGLNDAKFKMTPADASTLAINNLYGSNDTDSSHRGTSFDGQIVNGLLQFKNIPVGNYYIDEIETPAGFQKINRLLLTITPNSTNTGHPTSYTMTLTDTVTKVKIDQATFDANQYTDGNNILATFSKDETGGFVDKHLPPTISSVATDATTSKKSLTIVNGKGLVDTVSANNLTIGDDYEIVGTVTDATGKVIKTTSTKFTAAALNETHTQTFAFDTEQTLGDHVTVKEVLKDNSHPAYTTIAGVEGSTTAVDDPAFEMQNVYQMNVTDPDAVSKIKAEYAAQTVKVPTLNTTATDHADGDKIIGVGNAQIDDVSVITGLEPNTTYTENAQVVVAGVGTSITGKTVDVSIKFTTDADGNATVKLTTPVIDSSKLVGKGATMLETVVDENGTPIVQDHNYKDNAPETVTVATPTGSTQAKVESVNAGLATVDDDYAGSGYVPDTKVTVDVTGIFDHTLGKMLPASGQAIFTADAKGNVSGTIQVSFNDVASLGHEVTFIEQSSVNDNVVVQPSDKNDKKETVTVKQPTGATQVANTLASVVNQTIIDHYSYTNLIVGNTYTVTVDGAYLNHEDALNTEIASGQYTFVAKSENGTVDVPVTVKGQLDEQGKGQDLTFGESLYYGDGSIKDDTTLLVTNHNPNDDKETVHTVPPIEDLKDVEKTDDGIKNDSINHGKVALSSDLNYYLQSSSIDPNRTDDQKVWTLTDNYDSRYDKYNGSFKAYANTGFTYTDATGKTVEVKKGDVLPNAWFTAQDDPTHAHDLLDDAGKKIGTTTGTTTFTMTQEGLDALNSAPAKLDQVAFVINASFFRGSASTAVYNNLVENNNGEVLNPTPVVTKTPNNQPHKFDNLNAESTDEIKSNSQLNDDSDVVKDFALTEKTKDGKVAPTTQETDETFQAIVAATAKNPAVDGTKENSKINNNTYNVTLGQTYDFTQWMDTTAYDETSEVTHLTQTDYLDLTSLSTDTSKWTLTGKTDGKVLNSKLYTITVGKAGKDGKTPITVSLNATKEIVDAKGEKVKVIDTDQTKLGQYYDITMPVTVKSTAKAGVEITNTANETTADIYGNQWSQNTETRQNQVVVPDGSTQVAQTTIQPLKNQSYVDHVKLDNLTVGQTYTLKVPHLWDKTAGKFTPASGTLTFKATAKSQTVDITVHVDADGLGDHDLATFEDLYLKESSTGKDVLVHKFEDKNAKSETVHVAPVPTSPAPKQPTIFNINLPETGSKALDALLYVGSLMIALSLVGLGIWKRQAITSGTKKLVQKIKK